MTVPDPGASGAFRDFEQAGWQTAAGRYADTFGPLTIQAIGPLLDAVGTAPDVRLLDVATGPGYVAGAAAERGAHATGVDFSPVMVAEARRRYPRVAFREGEADCLPFPEETFGAVTINFGLLHFARPEQALAEARRVLRPGGRVGFTVWALPDDAVGFGIVLRAVGAHGNPDVPLPPGPPFFHYSDPAVSRGALEALGFGAVAVYRVPQRWQLPSPAVFFDAMRHGTVRTRALLAAQTPAALEAIAAAVHDALAAYTGQDGLTLPMPALLATGVKP